jgi:hypothetical protein
MYHYKNIEKGSLAPGPAQRTDDAELVVEDSYLCEG